MKFYLVGGAVRDLLMGNTPKDRDYVVVGGTAEELLARGFEQVGASFPVFLHPITREEYALARTERKVGAGYHGFAVDASSAITLEQDLARRDLTINAIAKDLTTGELVDPFDGAGDLRNKVLKHVSDAFSDDPLRVIRLARFAGRFSGFSIDVSTIELAQSLVRSGALNELPAERFGAEVGKVLDAGSPEAAEMFFKVLDQLHVHAHTTFFTGADMQWLSLLGAVCCTVNSDNRLSTFGALSRLGSSSILHLGGSFAISLSTLINKLRSGDRSSTFVRDLLISARLHQDGELFIRFLQAVQLGEQLGDRYIVSAEELAAAAKLVRPVAARTACELQAEGKTGRQIGEGVKAAEIKVLSQMFPS